MISVRDPVCGKEFDISEVQAHEDYRGWAYFFCSQQCRQSFLDHREHFTGLEQRLKPNASQTPKKGETVHE